MVRLGAAMLVVALAACGGQAEEQETTTTTAPGTTSVETTTSDAPTTTEADLPPPDDAIDVSILGFAFNPNPLTIEAGETVLWVNNDGVSHTSTSKDGLWNSGSVRAGAQYFFTFDQPGEYAYFCSIHPEMMATVVVE